MRERKRTRLIGFDYTTPGGYFVTVAVKDRSCVFCDITNGTCALNSIGQIVADQWRWLHDQYLYLVMDEFVVMPNHFHGIINIADSLNPHRVGNGRDPSLRSRAGLLRWNSRNCWVGGRLMRFGPDKSYNDLPLLPPKTELNESGVEEGDRGEQGAGGVERRGEVDSE